MKIASWKDCLEENASLVKKPDLKKSISLVETAKARILFLEKNEITNITANFLFEGYSSSVTELLHAIVYKKGFSVNNHICLGFYIRDVLKKDSLFNQYNDCRYKRNSLLYYGKQMHFEIAKESIEKTKKLITEILFILK